MRTLNLSPLEQALRQAEEGLGQLLARRESIAVHTSPDASDEVQFHMDRELAARSLSRESRMLLQVKLALKRIEDGSYGVCLRCEGEIGSKRMVAIPWASYCVQCQDIIDQERDDWAA
jgi:DnaK suppressor protein